MIRKIYLIIIETANYIKLQNRQMSQQQINILYIDDTCTITDVCIQIKKYYFPLATSRTILFDQIERITIQTTLHASNKWGLSRHHLNNWFSLDKNRKGKCRFLAIHLKDKTIIPSFTPLDPLKVYNLLREYFQTHGLNHVIFDENLSEENNFEDIYQKQSQNVEQGILDKQLQSVPISNHLQNTKQPLMESTSDNFFANKK